MRAAATAGSALSNHLPVRFGEARIVYAVPVVIIASLVGLAALQVVPAVGFIGIIRFVTAVVRPRVLNRIQHQVSDATRDDAFGAIPAVYWDCSRKSANPGRDSDQFGLPAAYIALAGGLSGLVVVLFWLSHQYFPRIQPRAAKVREAA